MGVSHGLFQLLVGMELQESVQIHRLLVALVEEDGIGLQPLAVLRKESLEFLAAEDSLFLGLEESLEVTHFLIVDVLIVRKIQRVQFLLLFLVGLQESGTQFAHFLDIDIDRMQRKHRHGIVGVRVAVGVRQRGVVDR